MTRGITPIKLSQEKEFQLDDVLQMRESAKRGRRRIQSEYDCRMAGITVGMFPDPPQKFLLTPSLVDTVARAVHDNGGKISQGALLVFALQNTEGAVHPYFSADAINDINASYYRTPHAFSKRSGVVTIHAENLLVNRAYGKVLADHAGQKNIRVKELSCGNPERWHAIGEAFDANQQVVVMLTDVIKPVIPAISFPSSLTIFSEQHDLFVPFPLLSDKEKLDAMMISYGFDSVWFPEDMLISRRGDRWFRYFHRVKVADWHPRKKALLEALRTRQALPNAGSDDYEGIFVEDAVQAIDLAGHPFEKYLTENIADEDTVNVPGGLISTVVTAFKTQLRSDGIFIIGDVSEYGVGEMKRSSYLSGRAARFKAEDYSLAKIILEKRYGFAVELFSLLSFVKKYVGDDWGNFATERERGQIKSPKNSIMIVRN